MVNLSITVQGEKQFSRRLMLNVRRLEDLQPFYKGAIDIVNERSDVIFKTSGRTLKNAPKWKDLQEDTHRARANRWGYYKKSKNKSGILQWTGELRDSRTLSSNKNGWSLEFTAPHAKYHAKGAWNLPKRAIIDIDNPTATKIVKKLQEHIQVNGWIFWRQIT